MSTEVAPPPSADEIKRAADELSRVRTEVARVIVGQKYMVERMLSALLADGHLLVEGVPGLAKTTAIKALAGAIHGSFSRVQFTPDLLPADVVGTQVYNPREMVFTTRKGPTTG